ncbi:IPT/TIG domain-containing protein [Streptomyces sp. ME19-01-6]|uniref:IPT/TIG domain-containing protein n=1 Tax=Streptomyces sp. ME19-01-6 TaxID=3028686 RepID=UPI0029BB37E1|nr:IPT/TIG domain-containing protein [Streptomyces sp. ME19-01-6]MDX3231268.1 IPT/TIG domain-containing protein [Streptomyces sp. ME19-01-6]
MLLTPSDGSTGGGDTVTVTGTDLGGATSVYFGPDEAAITGNTATSVTVVSPAGSGVVPVVVATAGGPSAPQPLFYIPPPVVIGVSPSSGPLTGGGTLVITGRHLLTATAVSIGGSSVTPTVVSDTTLQVTALAQAAGVAAVAVTTRGGVADDVFFTYVAPPSVTGFAPITGLTTGGTTVAITGTDLLTTTGVTFGGVPAAFGVISDTQVAAITPPHALGAVAVAVAVTTTGGSDTAPATYLYL